MARMEPLQILKFLPKTNCKECGEATCLAFATKLMAMDKKLEECIPMLRESQYAQQYQELKERLRPPIRPVEIGSNDRKLTVGGEMVLHRHELTFFNQTKMCITMHDSMAPDELKKRAKWVDEFCIFRQGKDYTLDMICLRSTSQHPSTFQTAINTIREVSQMPLILASYNPEVLEAGLEVEGMNRPLLYAATKDNWHDIAELAMRYDVPVVVSSPDDMDGLSSLAQTFHQAGIEVILDPGTYTTSGWFGKTLRNMVVLRRSAIVGEKSDLGWPIITVPAVIYAFNENTPEESAFQEALSACLFMSRYSDIAIMNTNQFWSVMAMIAYRQAVYQDPRVHPAVDPGLYPMNNPDSNSPVALTTNFALTFYTVKADIEATKKPLWLAVVDTGALGVEAAAAGGQLNTDTIVETLEKAKIHEKTSAKKLILPGLAARFSGELEDVLKWDVKVGPKDSADIKKVL